MSKHEKFVFDDLPEDSVVNKKHHERDNGLEEFINSAVTEHIKKIVESPRPYSEYIEEIGAKEAVQEEQNEVDAGADGEHQGDVSSDEEGSLENSGENAKKTVDESSETHNIDDHEKDAETHSESESVQLDETENQAPVDIEAIKRAEYDRGYLAAESEQANRDHIDRIKTEYLKVLQGKLEEVAPSIDLEHQVSSLTAEAIIGIAKKLHLVLPVNFEEIIAKGLLDKLKRFYKEGAITVRVHPEKYELCSDFLHSAAIPDKFKNKFNVLKDEALSEDDCVVEWEDTRLEYSKEQLSEEIEKIIGRLQPISKDQGPKMTTEDEPAEEAGSQEGLVEDSKKEE